jgi:hypothetical protein
MTGCQRRRVLVIRLRELVTRPLPEVETNRPQSTTAGVTNELGHRRMAAKKYRGRVHSIDLIAIFIDDDHLRSRLSNTIREPSCGPVEPSAESILPCQLTSLESSGLLNFALQHASDESASRSHVWSEELPSFFSGGINVFDRWNPPQLIAFAFWGILVCHSTFPSSNFGIKGSA